MRLALLPLVASAAACSAVVSGFAPSPSFGAIRFRTSIMPTLPMTSEAQETPCDIPTDVINPDLVSKKGSGKILRSAMLTDVNGEIVRLGDKMGTGTSIVIFLRHMG